MSREGRAPPDRSVSERDAEATQPARNSMQAGLPNTSTPSVAHLLPILTSIQKELRRLHETVEFRLKYDKTKEAAFDRLYHELDQQSRDVHFDLTRPLYMDLILFHDRIEKLKVHAIAHGPGDTTLSEALTSIHEELLEILCCSQIEVVAHSSPIFDPMTQRAVGTLDTDNIERHNQVAQVVRKGFRFQDHLLRAEDVIVMKCKHSS